MAKLLSELAVGTKVKFGKYQVNTETPEPIVWVIAAKNHTGYPENSVTLHTPECIDFRCLDGAEFNNVRDANRKKYGNSQYSVSNIDQWLNSDAEAGEWYTARHAYDMPPTATTTSGKTYTAYSDRPGFLKWFTPLEINAVLSSTIRVAKCPQDGGGYEDITRKVFLPSMTEVGSVNNSNIAEGALWDYYSTASNKLVYPTKQCVTNLKWSIKQSVGLNWLMRTPNHNDSITVYYVTSSGTGLGYAYAYDGYKALRPALNVSSALKVGDTPDTEGCYTIDLTPDPAPTPTATFTATSDSGGTLTNVTTAMKYSLDGGASWKSITGTTVNITAVTPENGIKVKRPGNGTTTKDSETQSITVTRAPTPDLTPIWPDALGDNGSIPMMVGQEYSVDRITWISATGSVKLDVGTYYVRTKASGTKLTSDVQTIKLIPGAEVTPCVARAIKDRIAIGDDCFKMEQLEDGRIKLTPAPDSIAEAGTDVNRALLQIIENRVVLLMNRVFDGITSNPFVYTFASLSGLKITGVWNETAARVEC